MKFVKVAGKKQIVTNGKKGSMTQFIYEKQKRRR